MPIEFTDAIIEAGFQPPDIIEPGKFHRFPGLDKRPNNQAGWCKLFDDGQSGCFGDFSSDFSGSWFKRNEKSLTRTERTQHFKKIADTKKLAEIERNKGHAVAAAEALKLWESASPALSHPYLKSKGIKAHGIREQNGKLIVPARQGEVIHSIQTIDPTGRKRFHPSSRTMGCYYMIGSPGELIYVCEGYATGASIHEATGSAVAIAFSAGNLRAVAEALLKEQANTKIIIASDNDENGAGQKKAMEAAEAISGSVAVPPVIGDWNDYAAKHGADELKLQLRNSLTSCEIDGSIVLNQIQSFLRRFVAYPDPHCLVAHTLWIAHAHLIESFESTPRLAFLSPEPASGKTRALEITEMLVPNPVEAVNVTPAYLFRKVGDEESKPTILYDEIDTVFGPKAKNNEEIRGLLNAGHRKGAVAGRCVAIGNTIKTEEISAYGAVALAGLGSLPETILSRSIIVRMRKRSPSEKIEPYRRRIHRSEGEQLKAQIAQWCSQIASSVARAFPALPEGVADRDADMWEPLFAIADAAGGKWPRQAREAALALVTQSKESTPSLGVQLLTNLREVFADQEKMFTTSILAELNKNDEWPWGNLRGSELDPRGLADLLRPYGIARTTIRVNDKPGKGYRAIDLYEPWTRYTPPLLSKKSVTSVTTVTQQPANGVGVTHVTDVTDFGGNGRTGADE